MATPHPARWIPTSGGSEKLGDEAHRVETVRGIGFRIAI